MRTCPSRWQVARRSVPPVPLGPPGVLPFGGQNGGQAPLGRPRPVSDRRRAACSNPGMPYTWADEPSDLVGASAITSATSSPTEGLAHHPVRVSTDRTGARDPGRTRSRGRARRASGWRWCSGGQDRVQAARLAAASAGRSAASRENFLRARRRPDGSRTTSPRAAASRSGRHLLRMGVQSLGALGEAQFEQPGTACSASSAGHGLRSERR